MKINELREKLQDALKLTARDRLKQLKQIGFEVLSLFKESKEPSIDELKCYAEILRIVIKIPDPSPKLAQGLSKIIVKTLSLQGCENPQIILKKSTKLFVDTATITIGDKFYSTSPELIVCEADYLKLINDGKLYAFDTGADGEYHLQIRVVDAPEPVLALKEYKKVVGSSPTIHLNIPTGQLVVDDGVISTLDQAPIEVAIEPGTYKCQVFIFEQSKDLDFSYYIVLAKTEHAEVNDEREVIRLEPCV